MRSSLAISMPPNPCSFSRRNNSLSTEQANGFITISLIIGFVTSYFHNLLFHLLKQVWQNFTICRVIVSDQSSQNLPILFIHTYVKLSPPSTLCPSMKESLPLAFAINLHFRGIKDKMNRLLFLSSLPWQINQKPFPSPTELRVMGNWQFQIHLLKDRAYKPLSLSKWKMIYLLNFSHAKDSCIRIEAWLSPMTLSLMVFPIFDSFLADSDCQACPLEYGVVTFFPVSEAVGALGFLVSHNAKRLPRPTVSALFMRQSPACLSGSAG